MHVFSGVNFVINMIAEANLKAVLFIIRSDFLK